MVGGLGQERYLEPDVQRKIEQGRQFPATTLCATRSWDEGRIECVHAIADLPLGPKSETAYELYQCWNGEQGKYTAHLYLASE
jgi:hypothetical protein